MKKNLVLTALSSALAASIALTASQAVAEVKMPLTGTVTLGVTSCGSYTKATFDDVGNLTLVGDWTCLGGGGETGGGETGGGETGGGETGGGETDGGDIVVDASCGTIPKGVTTNFNHPWDKNIASNIRSPISLSGANAYSLKINKPIGVKGYGNIRVASTSGPEANRTLVISDCPGSMVPAKTSVTNRRGDNSCVSTGIENVLTWNYNIEKEINGQCQLDPKKQYYINISHVSSTGWETCRTGSCTFIYDYNVLGIFK